MLVWLKDITKIKLEAIRADIPWSNKLLAQQVLHLQPSDKPGVFLSTRNKSFKSQWQTIITIVSSFKAFAKFLRAYVSTILPSLKCRMDIQTSDGKGMLLRYAASCVSKWHDAFNSDAMFSIRTGPYQAAYRHLRGLRPREPEMWMSLSTKKIAWSQSRTKQFSPISHSKSNITLHERYCKRPINEESISYLQWLRMYDPKGKPYKTGTTLVGVKLRSPFKDEYCYQDLLMNYAHRSTDDLHHEKHDDLPIRIKHFAAAVTLRPEVWKNETAIEEHFALMGNKDDYVETLIAYAHSRQDFLNLWQRRILGGLTDLADLPDLNTISDLSTEQIRVNTLVQKFLNQRQKIL